MLHSKNDVLLLTHSFRKFIDTCKSAYGINPFIHIAHQTAHGKKILTNTGVKPDKLTDDKCILLLESNMRGGPPHCKGNLYVKWGERKH